MNKQRLWKKFYKQNIYYHKSNIQVLKRIIEKQASIIEFGSRDGKILSQFPNKNKLGVNFDSSFKPVSKTAKIINIKDFKKIRSKFDYVLVNHALAEIEDIQLFITDLKKIIHSKTKIIVVSFNYLWKPFSDLSEYLDLKYPYPKNPNWLDHKDIQNLFNLESFEKVTQARHTLVPFDFSFIAEFVNKYIAPLPLINRLCMTQYQIFRPAPTKKEYSVSIIIPARNEGGNIKGILKKIPNIGKDVEVIFVEGHSTDRTLETIKSEIKGYKGKIKASYYKQKGKGKGDAVRLGFNKAKNEVLMILDADLTVDPKDLVKFYKAISENKGELIIGSRLVYPLENQAMRTLNYFGNYIFSQIFSFLLDQTIKDTLCGTKVILRSDYEKIEQNRKYFGDFDPFGDFDLIFGAKKLNLKIAEIPVRYKNRVYGKTNISRFTHGWLLFKMAGIAAKKLKFT
jgi:hypothetical protein